MNVPYTTLFPDTSPEGATQTVVIPNDPEARLDSFRAVFSDINPPKIPVVSGQPNFPAPGNKLDPNNGTSYDFVEFTERSAPDDGILFINTTQVDQVGLPFTMQTAPVDTVKPNGVGVKVTRTDAIVVKPGTYKIPVVELKPPIRRPPRSRLSRGNQRSMGG
jgi:hypothetical protein